MDADINAVINTAGINTAGQNEISIVQEAEADWRLDVFLAVRFPQYSRTLIRKVITNGGTIIDPNTEKETHGKPGYRLLAGQTVQFTLPELPREAPLPEPIPLDVLYEDDDLAVINKPVDMVVHPSRGHWGGTLVSALAYRFDGQLSGNRGPARPGIVHRLDRDTTGVILVAKNDAIHGKLAALFEERRIRKEYFAIVFGSPHLDRDMIDAAIGHHPKVKEKMSVFNAGSSPSASEDDVKPAQTFYEVVKRYGKFATLRCLPKTGRTHQIRVHLAFTGYPILCDRMYGGRRIITREELLGERPTSLTEDFHGGTVVLQRQALHAHRLTFTHPATGKELEITAPLPSDIQAVIDCLEKGTTA